MNQTGEILEVRNIDKEFPGVRALKSVSLAFRAGEVHGLVGENGAGKSTLMRIMAGAEHPTRGEMLLAGERVSWRGAGGVAKAQRAGIAMIHQELNLVDELSVAENIFLGRESSIAGFVRTGKVRQAAAHLLRQVGSRIDPKALVRDLSVAQRQLVEIAKAVSCRARVLIMDEPTAVLTSSETESLFRLIGRLRQTGVTIIYISHILPEILRICDRLTVMRDGAVVRTLENAQVMQATERQVASLMVGRAMAEYFPGRIAPSGEVVLEVRDLSSEPWVHHASLTIRRGEILGIAGLVGAGRTELAETIAGLRQPTGGEILLHGVPVKVHCSRQAVKNGIAYLSEDRKGKGLSLPMSTSDNIVMVSLKRYSAGLLRIRKQHQAAQANVKRLRIRVADVRDPVANLSGGNQQKVALAKWLEINPRVLILDEPTRGVDIGAKEEIYKLIQRLAADGMACLMISSELNELLGMCHRIAVMREGRIVATVDGGLATEESLMGLAAGVA